MKHLPRKGMSELGIMGLYNAKIRLRKGIEEQVNPRFEHHSISTRISSIANITFNDLAQYYRREHIAR